MQTKQIIMKGFETSLCRSEEEEKNTLAVDQTGISRRYYIFTSHTKEAWHKVDNCSECCNCSSFIQRIIVAISQFSCWSKRSGTNKPMLQNADKLILYLSFFLLKYAKCAVLEGLQEWGYIHLLANGANQPRDVTCGGTARWRHPCSKSYNKTYFFL